MMPLLSGKVALVTGAGGGIGRGIALSMAAHGATVIVGARREETGLATTDEITAEGGQAVCTVMDVTDEQAVANAIESTVARFGRLDVVVHNAMLGATRGGAGTPTQLSDIDIDHWRAQAAVATGGTFTTAKHARKHLQASGGSFIILISVAGLEGSRVNPCYAAIKGGQRGLVRALAREWGPDGIRVLGVAPAAESDSAKRSFAANPDLKAIVSRAIPLRRVGDPRRDIGDAVSVLVSDGTRYMTGQSICIDGGMYTAL